MPAPAFSGAGGFDSAFFAAYKHVYNQHKIQRLAYRNRPLFAALRKEDMFEGDTYNHSVMFEDPQGGSMTFATAIAQKMSSSQGARFILSRGREYQAISMDVEAIAATRSDKGSLLRKKVTETDRIIEEMSRRIDIAIHGDGTGILASFTTGSSLATTTITLDQPALGLRFSVGMYVQFATNSPTDGTAPTLADNGKFLQVISRNVTAKVTTITLSGQLASIGGLATTNKYFLVRNGCGIGFGTSNPYGGVSGLKSWLPINGPTVGESFWGFDRSVDAQRLAGSRYIAAPGEKFEVTLQNASAELELQNASADVVLLNPVDLNKYSQELGTKVRYMESDPGTTGLKTAGAMIIRGQSGDMKAISDPQVDPGTFYMLDMSTWWLATLNGVPHLDTADGSTARRESTSDGIEIRWRAWYQMVCDAPGRNMVGTFGY